METDDVASEISDVPKTIRKDAKALASGWRSNMSCVAFSLGVAGTIIGIIWTFINKFVISKEAIEKHPYLADPVVPSLIALFSLLVSVIAWVVDNNLGQKKTNVLLWCFGEHAKGGRRRRTRADELVHRVMGTNAIPKQNTAADGAAAGDAAAAVDAAAAGDAAADEAADEDGGDLLLDV